MDIAAGDTHCLALTDEGVVYAWGTNSMGQCGQGNTTSSVARPHKILGLFGVPIKQISAGKLILLYKRSVYIISLFYFLLPI